MFVIKLSTPFPGIINKYFWKAIYSTHNFQQIFSSLKIQIWITYRQLKWHKEVGLTERWIVHETIYIRIMVITPTSQIRNNEMCVVYKPLTKNYYHVISSIHNTYWINKIHIKRQNKQKNCNSKLLTLSLNICLPLKTICNLTVFIIFLCMACLV